jgi:hypothetical protein
MKDLAERINAEHGKAERALRSGVEHAARAGELLLKAKEKIGHGGWLGCETPRFLKSFMALQNTEFIRNISNNIENIMLLSETRSETDPIQSHFIRNKSENLGRKGT